MVPRDFFAVFQFLVGVGKGFGPGRAQSFLEIIRRRFATIVWIWTETVAWLQEITAAIHTANVVVVVSEIFQSLAGAPLYAKASFFG